MQLNSRRNHGKLTALYMSIHYLQIHYLTQIVCSPL